MASSSSTHKTLAYFGMPVLFCLLGYAVLFGALQPVWGTITATIGLLVADEAPTFDSDLSVVYDPEAKQSSSQTGQQSQSQGGGQNVISGDGVVFPENGEQYGQLVCESIGLDAPVYWGDSDDILMYGLGQSIISLPPGFGTAIILSGHNNTFFKCLQNVARGNVMQFHTNYGDYKYQIVKVEVLDENDLLKVLIDKAADETQERLIIYTCYPFHVVTGRKTDRLVAYGRKISGPKVEWRSSE